MDRDPTVLQVVEFDGFGGPSHDGKYVSIELRAKDGKEIDLQLPITLAHTIVGAISTYIAKAKAISSASDVFAGFPSDDLELYRDKSSGNFRIDFSAKDQLGLSVFVPIHRLQKLGSAIDRILLTEGRAN